ncbi:MAG: CDP-alcohol phosphatidyltransferase family protein, partial [Alphaproteobacteria bacterium]|nr:CDP-alcohol phosphatidyltransferase family protein [Alphaproteobacteria bacterium]
MVLNIPNVLTVSRILVIPVVLGFIYWGGPWGNWLAFSAYTYACVTDFFDGYLARAWHQQSAFGRFLDP